MGFLLRLYLMCLAAVLAACASTPKGPLTLAAQLEHRDTISLKLEDVDAAHLVVRGHFSESIEARFIIDTGATVSMIYPDMQARLKLTPAERTSIRVHGMISSQLQPIAELPPLTLAQTTLPSMRVAVIARPENDDRKNRTESPDHDGILGMDVLSSYHIYLDVDARILKLIPQRLGPPVLPANWDVVELSTNPFLEDGRELHFFQLRLGNALTPALLDTGSQYSMMNWNTDRFPRLRAVKKKLRKNWEIEGAIGTFKPVTKILSKNARAGQKFWGDNEFLVLDFESLNVLGIDGKPFVIAGLPMFNDGGVLIDFEMDRLYFAPDGNEPTPFITVN